MGINYPNESDKILGEKGNLGGDIFIHGSNVTVGCMPMTDEVIREIYILNIEAKNAGQTQQENGLPGLRKRQGVRRPDAPLVERKPYGRRFYLYRQL